MSSIKAALQFLIFAFLLIVVSLEFNFETGFLIAMGLLALIFIGLPIVLFIDSLFALAGNKPINKQSHR
jgi:hypothetical protein